MHTIMEHGQDNTIQKKIKQNKNFQTQEILHSICVIFVSVYCIFKYLQYLRIFFIGVLIVAQLGFEFLSLEDMHCKCANLNFKIRTLILQGFSVICIAYIVVTIMWLEGH